MTMAWCWDGELHVVVHDKKDPTDVEWNRYVTELHQFTMRGEWKILVYSAGGTPTGHQRHALTKTFRGHPVALVTASPIMRAMGIVMRALDPNIRVISPQDEELAFSHLRLSDAQRRRAQMHHEQLIRQVMGRSRLDQSAAR